MSEDEEVESDEDLGDYKAVGSFAFFLLRKNNHAPQDSIDTFSKWCASPVTFCQSCVMFYGALRVVPGSQPKQNFLSFHDMRARV